jgi:hypothetical protein
MNLAKQNRDRPDRPDRCLKALRRYNADSSPGQASACRTARRANPAALTLP